LVVGRLTVPNIESRCNQLKLGHPRNMHTTRFPGGEIRGQIAVHRGDGDDDEN
jgi:hypothetical protein